MAAVGTERISQVVGYSLTGADFSTTTPNLPERIAILAEANNANQSGLDTNGREITSAKQAGDLYGYGSPIYNIMRILKPYQGDGVGGIPIVVYPQAAAAGATYKVMTVTPSGTATGSGTHTVIIAGRRGLDSQFYDINITVGDNAAAIIAKIVSAVTAVLGCPMSVANTTSEATFTSKWKGLTANALTISIDTNGDDLGITYAVATTTAGSATPSITAALGQIGNAWVTTVINSYGTVPSILSALETFNGRPSATNPTGRYTGIIMKPFVALTGSVAEDPSSVTDSRKNDCTIAICPAPLSAALPMEAAANMAVLHCRTAQDTPHLDVSDLYYPDMPAPASIGAMSSYDSRDAIVKKGCSTVDLVDKTYKVMDFVTTYHPDGENPAAYQFSYVRNLKLDFNVRFTYYLLEQLHLVGHVIARDSDIVNASNTIKPKQWKAVLYGMANELATRALIVDPEFTKASISVAVNVSNPNRLDVSFKYKRSGVARIISTTAVAGFNFGTINN